MNPSLSPGRKMAKSRLLGSSEWRFNLFLSFLFYHQPPPYPFHSFLFDPPLFGSCRVEMVTFQFSGSFPAFFPSLSMDGKEYLALELVQGFVKESFYLHPIDEVLFGGHGSYAEGRKKNIPS
ncbi:hypothetical protein NPIL_689461 [Nephila pilipes]|uniref:Uncharacterized protein n=1 Tax=Nephila pilipes TaxID=299642 RepID=A0A8X6P9E3_NEPPI|nr:hypothetical protein NPIL_689461 [Nephila pilipes]